MTDRFAPTPWPEDPAPAEAAGCRQCELCRQRRRVVWGEGNPAAPILAILDNPGEREDPSGNEYVCGTRQALQRAAHEAGLAADDLYATYLLKCRPVRAYDKPAARTACMPYLLGQMERQKPRLILCLGNTIVKRLYESEGAEVKDLRGAWHNVRRIPTAVTYHPLAVRRRPNLYRLFLEDWRMVAARLRLGNPPDTPVPH